MSTENEVINEWKERRDLMVAVKERLDDQFGVLTTAVVTEYEQGRVVVVRNRPDNLCRC